MNWKNHKFSFINIKFIFINLWDEKGWEGKTAEDYYIYATPTMFLVDKENKIISKPMTINELGKL